MQNMKKKREKKKSLTKFSICLRSFGVSAVVVVVVVALAPADLMCIRIFWFENKQAQARTHIMMTAQYTLTIDDVYCIHDVAFVWIEHPGRSSHNCNQIFSSKIQFAFATTTHQTTRARERRARARARFQEFTCLSFSFFAKTHKKKASTYIKHPFAFTSAGNQNSNVSDNTQICAWNEFTRMRFASIKNCIFKYIVNYTRANK